MQNINENFDAISEEELDRYSGEWVAVLDKKIVAHARDFKQVYDYVRVNYPSERALIGKVPENIPVVLSPLK